MKIFNVEKGVKKVYVQFEDIIQLLNFGGHIPNEVMHQYFMDTFLVTNENRYKFAEFSEPHTIEFFEKVEWIPDFREYKDLSEKQIMDKGQLIAEEMNQIAEKWNAMSDSERHENEQLALRYDSLEYKMQSVAEILWVKQGYKTMKFPIAPDDHGFVIENENYIAQQGLNPFQYVIYRKDGKELKKKEFISEHLENDAEFEFICNSLENNEFFGEYEKTTQLSEDHKYIVNTYRIITPEELEKKNGKNRTTTNKMTLGKRIKNIFSKKRSN